MLEKAYDPQATEDRIYAAWEKTGAFSPTGNGEPFTISMPPPNATGNLHLGHAVMLALEDIFTRFARMQGKDALWVPGTDHAAIATENVVIKQLKAEGMRDPRKELGREGLIAKIAAFVEQSRGTIRGQVRKMGSSCDWTRERYTLEPTLNRCVNDVFAAMYRDGLIYRGHRIVNWDPKLQTTVSDDELVYVEESVPFYTFQYGPFQIGTVRPETKFGDKYVVMHPDDERYAQYEHGDTIDLEWINGPIRATIIKDIAVDPAFGTGVMTITPWHTAIDFDIAERHGLEKEQVIDFHGKLLPMAGEFAGMPIEEARPLIVEKLRSKGLLVKVDDGYVHNKAVSQRGGGTIEPQIKLQWFIDVNKKVVRWDSQAGAADGPQAQLMSLKEILHSVVHHGHIAIIPERFGKTYFHWIDNLRDWCISRQIWWGHRVPVWYRGEETVTGHAAPAGGDWQQDSDTLDTWFSSALWTWSTLVDPKAAADPSLSLQEILAKSPDYQRYHPTTVMETGYDILFFWVARMILMTTYATGRLPFKTVYLHGLIRTRDGKKMSKSDPKTMIDPLDMIAKYGADALRLSMIVGQSPGNDGKLYEEKIAGYRNFVNKLWNASRFVLMKCEEAKIDPRSITALPPVAELSLPDRAILHASEALTRDVIASLEAYRLSEAGERLYAFVWDLYCDWYLELSKGTANTAVLVHVLRRVLRLLHPYCPFVTEELWAHCGPKDAGLLMLQPSPSVKPEREDTDAFARFQAVIDVITAVRRLRADAGIEPGREVPVILHAPSPWLEALQEERASIQRMAKVGDWTLNAVPEAHANAVSVFLERGIEVHIPLEGIIDLGKERVKLTAERDQLFSYLASIERKLSDRGFVGRAPAHVISAEEDKRDEATAKLAKLDERIKTLGA